MTDNRILVTLVREYNGVLEVIGPTGNIEVYIQRGVKNIPEKHKRYLKLAGALVQNAEEFKEFPSNYKLVVEDPSIQGRVTMSFPYQTYIKQFHLN